MNRILVLTVLAAAAAGGCGAAPPQRAHQHLTAPARSALTEVQACQLLQADITRNAGAAGTTVLRHIADHVTAPRMAADARTAVRDIDHTGIAPLALSLLRDDCARAGVHIPHP
jgi:hypothetical protein